MNQTNNRIRDEWREQIEIWKDTPSPESEGEALETVTKWWLSKIDELLKSQREEIVKQFIEIEKDKWKDAEHCTCLGYAIVKIFGKKYEKILQDLSLIKNN